MKFLQACLLLIFAALWAVDARFRFEKKTVDEEEQDPCSCSAEGNEPNCVRVRKEFLSLTLSERKHYLDVVVNVSTSKKHKHHYEKLVTLHNIVFDYDSGVHISTYFLAWHRWFLIQYENLLREVDPCITVPYWQWSFNANTWTQSEIWNDTHGFGGNGSLSDSCVTTGPFSGEVWSKLCSAGGGCLKRAFNFMETVPTESDLQKLLKSFSNQSQFQNFTEFLEVCYHDPVHCAIGGGPGDMCHHTSANDPIFFLHHAYIDKIWFDWQQLNDGANMFNDFYDQQQCVMPGSMFRSRDFEDYNMLPRNKNGSNVTKVIYQPKQVDGETAKVLRDLQELSLTQLKQINTIVHLPASEPRRKLFNKFENKECEKLFKPNKGVTSQLRGQHFGPLGFDTEAVRHLAEVQRRKREKAERRERLMKWFAK